MPERAQAEDVLEDRPGRAALFGVAGEHAAEEDFAHGRSQRRPRGSVEDEVGVEMTSASAPRPPVRALA